MREGNHLARRLEETSETTSALALPTIRRSLTGRDGDLATLSELLKRTAVVCVCGVAGVGKSALVRQLASDTGRMIIVTELGRGSLEALLEDARCSLGATAPTASDRGALLQAIDAIGALWIVEDIHVLDRSERQRLAAEAAALLHNGRCLITSRERLVPSPSSPPWGELMLTGLSQEAAALLWSELERLQRPLGTFVNAWTRSRGNPLLLRCHHAGYLEEDPVSQWVGALRPDERHLMACLALCQLPLPPEVLESLTPGRRGIELVRSLIDRMLIEVDVDYRCRIHDLFREAVLDTLADDERLAIHEQLATELESAKTIEPALLAREVARHLTAIGRGDEGISYLIRRGTELDRFTAAEMLRRGNVPEHQPSTTRASAEVDLGHHLTSSEQVAREGALGIDFTVVVAELLMARGQPERSIEILLELLGRDDLNEGLRLRALIALGMTLSSVGRFHEAERWIGPRLEHATDPRARATLAMVRAYGAWFAGHDEDAYELSRTGNALLHGLRSYRLSALIPAIHSAIAGALGHLDESAQAIERASKALTRVSDPVIGSYARHMMAIARAHAGELMAAESELYELLVLSRTSGFNFGVMVCSITLGWVFLLQGQTERGRATMLETSQAARACGFHGLANRADVLQKDDPLRQLDLDPPAPLGDERTIRSLTIEALHAGRVGNTGPVEDLVQAVRDRGADVFYGACCEIARALVDLHQGTHASLANASDRIQAARAMMREAGRDDRVVEEILQKLAPVRLASASGIEFAEIVPDVGDAIVIDERSGELRYAGQSIDLRRRPILQRLLSALGRHLGKSVSKDELMWSCTGRGYDPLIDDSGLKANMNHLRKWLAPAALGVVFAEGGYRLVAPETTVHISQPLADLADRGRRSMAERSS